MGTTLRKARQRKHWSVDDVVAAASGKVSRATVYRIEAGITANPGHDTVVVLETALGLRRGSLVFGPDPERAEEVA